MEEGGVIIWSMIYTEKGWGRGGRGARGQPVGQGHMRGGPHNRGYAWGYNQIENNARAYLFTQDYYGGGRGNYVVNDSERGWRMEGETENR